LAEKIRRGTGAVERLLLPRLNSIDGELKAINTRIDGVYSRMDGFEKTIDSMKGELRAEIKVVDTKIEQLDRKLDIDRRITVMEAKMQEFDRNKT
jgi:hypothetical protein